MSSTPAPIEFRACAGLANRMRALASALCLASELGRPMRVIWNVDGHCGARFPDLFETGCLPPGVSVDGNPPTAASMEITSERQIAALVATDKKRPIYIHSHQPFYQERDEERFLAALRSLQPTSFLRQMVVRHSAVLAAMAGDVRPVGVHVRRTDHVKATKQSPRDAFVAEMRKYDPETVFFLATDDVREVEALRAAFPDRICHVAATTERGSVVGVQVALVDMLMLEGCSRIIGSFGSSFCEVAAQRAGIPLEIARR